MQFCHVVQQDLGHHFRAFVDVAECGVYGLFVVFVLHVFDRLVQLAGALHEPGEDVNDVEPGLALFGEIQGGFVCDDLGVCESFEFIGAVCRFGWEALFDIVCFCLLVMVELWRVSMLTI